MSYSDNMADTITIRTDDETEHALDVLTHDGSSRSAAIRQAVLEAASRRERAAEMRKEVLQMNLGQPDGVNVAEELTHVGLRDTHELPAVPAGSSHPVLARALHSLCDPVLAVGTGGVALGSPDADLVVGPGQLGPAFPPAPPPWR